MALKKVILTDSDKVFIRQHEDDGRGCGDLNNDGHLYFIDEAAAVAYMLPDAYKDTPLILYHPCGGYQDGLIMVSLLGEVKLQYHHTFYDVAGLWGWIDLDGNVVIQPQYVFAMSFFNGQAIVCKGDWDIDDNGCYWCNNEQWGIIDRQGKEIVPCRFDEIFYIDGTDRFILCHKGGWESGCNCIFDTEHQRELIDLDFNFDNGYMFNKCFYEDGKVFFARHEPGDEIDDIYVYGLQENTWIAYHEPFSKRTLNGKTKIVLKKDGEKIIVF